jgi:hypothetical protein
MLPKCNLPTETVTLSGGEVVVTGLTVDQVKVSKGRNDVAVSFACGVTQEEAKEWLGSVPAGDAAKLIEAIMRVSGLAEGAQKSK